MRSNDVIDTRTTQIVKLKNYVILQLQHNQFCTDFINYFPNHVMLQQAKTECILIK